MQANLVSLEERVSNIRFSTLLLLAFLLHHSSATVSASRVPVKDADTLRLESEIAAAESSSVLILEIASGFLEDHSVSKASRLAALGILEESLGEQTDVYLEGAFERLLSADPALAVSVRLAMARRALRKNSSAEAEVGFLGQALRDGLEAGEPQYLVRFYAEELCDRGAGTFLPEIEYALGTYIPPQFIRRKDLSPDEAKRRSRNFVSPRQRERLALCRKQIAVMAANESALDAYREALVTEDRTPGMRLHEWAIQALLEMESPIAEEILLEYALTWQNLKEGHSRYVFARLMEKGWTEERLIERGWKPTPPSKYAVRPAQPSENPD